MNAQFQNPWFKVRQYGALPHFLCHVLNSVKNICVNILEHSRAQQDAYKPGFPRVFQYPASLTRKPMNSSSDENKKQQNEESSTPEGETNVLDASTVKCFPAVKRSFRQKQCNWRWRWKYFTRALQPISEQGENTKDDTSKVDSNVGNSAVDGGNESSEFPELKDQENLDSNNQHLVDCRDNFDSDNNTYSDKGRESVQRKEDYSACIKLIEKFQEAVLDNAVRIIQAAYKQFRERRRFLKLKKSATVIQRSVRQWLVLRHSNGLPALQATKPECEIDTGVKKNYCNQSELEREVSLHRVESEDQIEERQSVSDIADSLWSPTELANDVNGLPDSVSQEHEQFENSFESLDVMSLSGSTDNLSDTEVCIDQGEEIPPNNDPDSLSLADSGIDMGSDTTQEVAVIDDCECSKFENTSPLEKAVCTKNEVN